MIENMNTTELQGQTELTDFLQQPTQASRPQPGYDAQGQLINPDDTADRLKQLSGEINAITQHARVVLASAAIDIGRRLIEARGLVSKGRWHEWLTANVDYSERQAQVLMQLAEQYGAGELPEAYRGLGISHMTALLAAREEDREALAEQVKEEGLSVRELKHQIEQLKAEQYEQQLKLDATVDEAAAAVDALKTKQEEVDLARSKAKSAEESAEALRKLNAEAEDRASKEAQRARDAINRANKTVKELAKAKARIAELSKQEPQTVEVIPESVTRELDRLRSELADAKAKAQPVTVQAAEGPTAADRFKWFYANQMKPAFTSAAGLLREVAAEDPETAKTFATAILSGCKQLINLTEGGK